MNHFGRPTTPGAARGILPLIAGGLGAARAVYGAVSANQKKQKNRGYIGEAYRSAALRLDNRQADVRESTNESLVARGLTQGGQISATRAAMIDGKPVAQGAPATDLASQTSVDLGKEFAVERNDLDQAVKRAYDDNKADYLNNLVGSVGAGVQTAASVYGAGKDLGALRSMPPTGVSATRQAYLSGIDDPANAWGGIHPVDPLGAPGSTWNRSVLGAGQPNYAFNSGNV